MSLTETTVDAARRSVLAGLWRRVYIALLFVGYAAVVFFYLVRLSWTTAPNADNAGSVLLASDMVRGNWLLRGWWLPVQAQWAVELPLYAFAVAAQGVNLAVTHTVPAFVYLCLLVLTGLAAVGPFLTAPRAMWYAVCAALLPLAFPATLLTRVALLGPYHIGTIAIVLVFLLTVEKVSLRGPHALVRRAAVRLFLVSVLLAAAIAGDPFAIWLCVLPLAIVSGVEVAAAYRKGASPGVLITAAFPAGLACAAWGAGVLTVHLVTNRGGFTIVHLDRIAANFVEFSQLGFNVMLLVRDALGLAGADFFGRPADLGAIPIVLRLADCLAVALAIRYVLLRWRRGATLDWLSRVLTTAVCLLLAAFVFSTFSAVERTPLTARYLVPALVFGSIVLGRLCGEMAARLSIRTRWAGALTGVLVILFAIAPFDQIRTLPSLYPGRDLGQFLQRRGLHDGLGDYWNASIVTVASAGVVAVRPVIAPEHRITPYHWDSARKWYFPNRQFNFLVFGAAHYAGVARESAEATFGPPSETYYVGTVTVLVWDQGISLPDASDRP